MTYFSAQPGVCIPGLITIGGFPGPTGYSYYDYIGHLRLSYLDYITPQTSKVLVTYPQNIYAMFPVSDRAGLGTPPPDGRWGLPAAPSYEVVFREDFLATARSLNSAMQAENPGKPVRESRGIPRIFEEKSAEPSRASVMMAAARKRNAELQAKAG